ncbi:hypothetical protein CFU_0482 [Collimonas fungivorans Ter331]|uniref:Uncharacterized protein n=1 Tax=Collimonas fungivorans (strain Ter331) TaxID=1005048 RepID=G0AGI9_COLFT|nr:hypothetical protein CFU_0482 [Collimonas fungivorans Ter331]
MAKKRQIEMFPQAGKLKQGEQQQQKKNNDQQPFVGAQGGISQS